MRRSSVAPTLAPCDDNGGFAMATSGDPACDWSADMLLTAEAVSAAMEHRKWCTSPFLAPSSPSPDPPTLNGGDTSSKDNLAVTLKTMAHCAVGWSAAASAANATAPAAAAAAAADATALAALAAPVAAAFAIDDSEGARVLGVNIAAGHSL